MRSVLRLSVAAALLVAAYPVGAQAVTPAASVEEAQAAAARTLVDMLQLDRTLDSMFVQLKDIFAENAIATLDRRADGSSKAFFDTLPGGRDRFSERLGQEFLLAMQAQYPDFKQAAASEYAKKFSADELGALVTFFQSGVGAKWLSLSPELEKVMGKWGETAGMKAGAGAFAATMKYYEDQSGDEGKTQ